jgi:hypothetical protein
MMDDIYFTPETRLSTVFRTNSEIIAALASIELAEENIQIITELLKKHSDFVLDLSAKAALAERLDVRIVK